MSRAPFARVFLVAFIGLLFSSIVDQREAMAQGTSTAPSLVYTEGEVFISYYNWCYKSFDMLPCPSCNNGLVGSIPLRVGRRSKSITLRT